MLDLAGLAVEPLEPTAADRLAVDVTDEEEPVRRVQLLGTSLGHVGRGQIEARVHRADLSPHRRLQPRAVATVDAAL